MDNKTNKQIFIETPMKVLFRLSCNCYECSYSEGDGLKTLRCSDGAKEQKCQIQFNEWLRREAE